ncbi:HNH endonuclease [Vibrio cholerae]|nr:HNH endonuclease [Vibrio cholerae]
MIEKFKNVRDFTNAMLDIFNNEIQYRCPFWKDPDTCSCASCFNQRLVSTSRSALKAAEAKNISPSGTTVPNIKTLLAPDFPLESPKDKIARQRKERLSESDNTWAYVEANQARYSAEREAFINRTGTPKKRIEVPKFDLDEALKNPGSQAISPVNIDPASMLVDEIIDTFEAVKDLVTDPSWQAAAAMAVVAIPGKYADNLTNFVGKYKGKDIVLDDLKMVDVKYLKRNREELNLLRKEFNNGVRKDYLIELSKDDEVIKKLRQLNVPDAEINKLASGRVPASFEVHHKLPLDDSGTNDFSNLVLIRKAPEHAALTTYQKQTTKGLTVGSVEEVKWPVPDGSIYPKK